MGPISFQQVATLRRPEMTAERFLPVFLQDCFLLLLFFCCTPFLTFSFPLLSALRVFSFQLFVTSLSPGGNGFLDPRWCTGLVDGEIAFRECRVAQKHGESTLRIRGATTRNGTSLQTAPLRALPVSSTFFFFFLMLHL